MWLEVSKAAGAAYEPIPYRLQLPAYKVFPDIPSSSPIGVPSFHTNWFLCVIFSVYGILYAVYLDYICLHVCVLQSLITALSVMTWFVISIMRTQIYE